jgi:phospholipid/cholesterol/gamma-HCH transport system ATP-binding protein
MSWKVEFVDAGKRGAFTGLSFGAVPGTVTAVVGETGSGKTLALRMVCGLDRPDVGAVLVGGVDVSEARGRHLKRLRRGMSVMLQGGDENGGALFENVSVRENLAFGMRAAGHVAARRIDGTAHMYLERLSLGHVAHARPAELTQSERKRVALARALALRAPLVVLDDFDGSLPVGARDAVCDLVREELEDRLATYLVATRDAESARRVADACITLGR